MFYQNGGPLFPFAKTGWLMAAGIVGVLRILKNTVRVFDLRDFIFSDGCLSISEGMLKTFSEDTVFSN